LASKDEEEEEGSDEDPGKDAVNEEAAPREDLVFAMTGDLYVSDSVIEDRSLDVTRLDDCCPGSSAWEARPPLRCGCVGLESESSKSARAAEEDTDIEEPPREPVEMAAGAVRGRACGSS
jgi:hypothetical protein